jgi:hypothetical protein
MTPPTASLLQHLLTRSDLARLGILPEQLDAWLAEGSMESVGELPDGDGRDEQVLSVADTTLRSDLVTQLAAIGKSAVLLNPQALLAFLQGAASRNSQADVPEHVPVADADIAVLFAAVVAHLDGDLENVLRLARQAADRGSESPGLSGGDANDGVTEESMLRDNPIVLADSNVSAWFRDSQVDAMPTRPGAPLDDLVPLAGEDLEELAATVAFHSEQLDRLVDLPHTLDHAIADIERIRTALEDFGMLTPVEPTDASPVTGAIPQPTVFNERRTSLIAICLALWCWSALVWFGTGSAALAVSSFVAASVVGYLALQPASWRR